VPLDLALPQRYQLDPVAPLLGEGGMGRVYRVRDRVLDQAVALKVVRPDLAADVRFRNLFDVEVRLAARFTHPHIAPLHDVGALPDGGLFLGVALAEGGSLAKLCGPTRARVPEWPELHRLVLEITAALAYLHARGVLHRDIKPENVLLHAGPKGLPQVWLTDLGLASDASELARRRGRREGTPGYMAPEQAAGLPREIGPWTDLFAVGVMIWQALTGELPFGTTLAGVHDPLPNLTPLPGLEVPPGVEDVLARLLFPDPLGRFDLAADFARAWRRLGADGGAPLGPLVVPDAVPPWNQPAPEPIPARPPPGHGGAVARASLRLFTLADAPLVGRATELATLWDRARLVADDGKSRVVVVVGEAGSGKSHLARALGQALEEAGHAEVVSMAWSRPAAEDDGFAGTMRSVVRPWRETRASLTGRLRRLVGRDRGGLDADASEEVDALVRWCTPPEAGEEPVPEAFALRSLYRHLRARSWRGAVVLLMDDVQWSVEDGDGLAIGESLLRDAAAGAADRVLALLTVRAEDLRADPALGARVDALVAAGAERLDLDRLDRAGTEAVLAASIALEPALAAVVTERCAGNPLFARQLLREWVDRGWLVDRGDLVYRLAAGVDVDEALPADARVLLVERAMALARASGHPDAFVDAVQLAAMFGPTVPRELLAELVEEVGAADLGPYLFGCGLLRADGPELIRFDLALMQHALRERADERPDAAALHLRLARRLMRYAERTGADLDLQIGRHAVAGGSNGLGAVHLVRAAERAWRRGQARQTEEAAALAVAACEASASPGQVAEVHPLSGWARLWWATALASRGDGQRAADLFVSARRLLRSTGAAQGAQRALLGLAGAELLQGHLQDAEGLFLAAIDEGRRQADASGELRGLLGMANLEMARRNFEGASILCARVAERADRAGDRRAALDGLVAGATAARLIGDLEDAEGLFREAEERLGPDDVLIRVRVQAGLGAVARQRPDREPPVAELTEAAAVAQQLGAEELRAECQLELASCHLHVGKWPLARGLLLDVLGWASRNGRFDEQARANLGLCRAAMIARDRAAAWNYARDASILLDRVPGHAMWGPYRLLVAAMLGEAGDEEGAYAWLWSAADLGVGSTVDLERASLLDALAERASDAGWVSVGRVAGKLVVHQWERLGRADRAALAAARLPGR
jgi:tetratricopeptide (TPR) repeat protein/energy-coupling factor transporter ATP-binding protein EcfA2